MAYVAALPQAGVHDRAERRAPVLVLPRVFETDFCRHLIGLYRTHGGEQSDFMLQVDGRTIPAGDSPWAGNDCDRE